METSRDNTKGQHLKTTPKDNTKGQHQGTTPKDNVKGLYQAAEKVKGVERSRAGKSRGWKDKGLGMR